MAKRENLVLIKNAAANIIRGGAAAFVALALPPFLTRLMPADSYGAWSLVLQISAYVAYLDFGIQTAVGRFVAHANARSDPQHRDSIISTALAVLGATGILSIVGSVPVAASLPLIFRQMPPMFVGEARVALLLVASSLAVGLPASVFNGIFIGLQRNEIPAAIIGGSRILSAVSLVFVVRHGGDLIQMGAAVAGVNLASYILQYLMYRKMVPGSQPSVRLISSKTGRELFDYCLSLGVWSFAMLLVTGLDIALVGYFQFDAVAYYVTAASLITFLTGLQNAVFSVMVPSAAVLHARGDTKELGRVMITATRYSTFLLLLTGLPLVLAATHVLTLWVGPAYAARGTRILQVLVAANVIRLSAVPYVMALIGAGEQRLVTVTPLLEGVCNLVASIVAGYMFGALGVAVGTLIGALVGVGGNLLYNMSRTVRVAFRISDYLRDGLLRPAVCALPPIAFSIVLHYSDSSDLMTKAVGFFATLIVTSLLFWYWGLVGSERVRLRTRGLVPQL
jgi:O-antigen/teichoic acid export membrane protein